MDEELPEEIETEEFALPLCIFPERVSENYQDRVRKFFEAGGESRIERIATEITMKHGTPLKILHWDKETGLKNISFGSSGFDLIKDFGSYRYSYHNIYPGSVHERTAFEIAKAYVDMLDSL